MGGFCLGAGSTADPTYAATADRRLANAVASSSRGARTAWLAAPRHVCPRKGAVEVKALAAAALMPSTLSPSSVPRTLLGGANNISVAPPKLTPLDTGEGTLVQRIHSEEELQKILAANPRNLVVLMCKAMSCRPCKAFTRKYQRLAEQFSGCAFLDIYGDETTNTRRMMINMEVRVTPTFKLFRNGQCVHSHGGINEDSLRSAIEKYSPAAMQQS